MNFLKTIRRTVKVGANAVRRVGKVTRNTLGLKSKKTRKSMRRTRRR